MTDTAVVATDAGVIDDGGRCHGWPTRESSMTDAAVGMTDAAVGMTEVGVTDDRRCRHG
jgi:hypothetical protein